MTPAAKTAIALAAALALVPAAAADATVAGHLRTMAFEAQGDAATHAALNALIQVGDGGGSGQQDRRFSLTANHTILETQAADPVLVAPAGAAAAPVAPSSTKQEHRSLLLESHPPRPGHQLEVLAWEGHPMPLLEADTACLSIEPTDRERALHQPRVNSSRQLSVDVSDALLWSTCPAGSLRITGSFILTLWDWDAELRADGRSALLESGYGQSNTSPGGGLGYPTVASARQQYLFVEQGEFILLPGQQSPSVFLDSGTVSLDGQAVFQQAQGRLEGVRTDIDSQQLRLEGQLTVSIAPVADSALQVAVQGVARSGDSDGIPLSFTAVTSRPPPGALWLLGLIPPLALGGWTASSRRRLRNAQDRLEKVAKLPPSEAGQVERICTEILTETPQLARAYYFRGRARTHMGNLQGAQADLQEALACLPANDRFHPLAAWQSAVVARALQRTSELPALAKG